MDEAVREYIEFTIKLKLDEMQRGLQATNERIAEFDRKAKQNLNNTGKAFDDLDKKGQTLKSSMSTSLRSMEDALGSIAAKSGIAFGAIAAGAALAGKAFGDLQAQSNTLQAVSGASAKEMDALNAKALALGESSKYTATQVASTNVELAKLGFTSSEIKDAIDGVVAAAGASGTSLVNAGELIAGTVRGFSLAAKDANFVADVLAQAANKSALGFEDMQLSMKYIAPVAAASNQKLTDMVGIMAVLSNNMIKGETAGTALRSMMVSLQAPSGEAAGYIKKLGLEVADADGKIKPLPKIMGELQDKMKGLSQKTGNKVLAEIFGTEALPAVSVLMKTSKEDLAALIDQMEKATGASDKMTKIMNQGLNYELDQLKAKVETAAIKFGKELEPALTAIIKSLQKLVDWFGNLPEPVKQSMVQVGLLVGTVAALTGGFALAGKAAVGFIGSIGRVAAAALEAIPALNAYNAAASGGVAAAVAVPVLAGAGIGLGLNLYINSLTADQNSRTDADESDLKNEVGDPNQAMSRINSALNKSGKEQNFSKLTQTELKQSVLDSQTVINGLGKQIKDIQSINDRLKELRGSPDASTRSVLLEIDELEKSLPEATKKLRKAKDDLDKYKGLKDKFATTLDKAKAAPAKTDPKVAPNKENLFNQDDAAQRKADKALSDRVDAMVQKHERASQALKTQLEQQAATNSKASGQIATVNDAMASKLIKNSHDIRKAGTSCFASVYEAYKKTFGDGGMFDLMKGGRGSGDWAMAAADAANRLAQDTKRFHEVKINPQNYKEVMKNLKSTSIIVYDRGAGFSSATKEYGHIEVYDPKTGLASYGKGANKLNMTANRAQHARIFEMNTSGAGFTGDMKKNTQEQQILNQLTAVYNQQLQEAIALRNQMPAGSDAWKKADEHVFKLQQAMKDNGLDVAKLQAELQKAQAEAARKWALEQLDVEASMAEASAALTADKYDDLQAQHLRALTDIRKAELNRLAEEGTTQEQSVKLKAMYDLQRQVAHKRHLEAIQKLNNELSQSELNSHFRLQEAKYNNLEDGAEKQMQLSVLSERRTFNQLNQELLELKKAGKEKSAEYSDLEDLITALKAKGVKDREKIAQDAIEREFQMMITERQRNADIQTQKNLQGVQDPQKADAIRLDGLQEQLKIQKEISQHEAIRLTAEKLTPNNIEQINLAQQRVNDSKRTETKLELEKQQIVFQGIERETAKRREVLDMSIKGFTALLGVNNQLGVSIANWVTALNKGLSRVFDGGGNSLDIFKAMGMNSESMKWMNDVDTSTSGGGFLGLAGSIGGALIGGPIGSSVGGAVGGTGDFLLSEALKMSLTQEQFEAMASQHKANMAKLDVEILQQRIDATKAANEDTTALEKDLASKQFNIKLADLDSQEAALKAKRSGLFGQQTAEESMALQNFQEQKGQMVLAAETELQQKIADIKRQAREKEQAEEKAYLENLGDLKLENLQNDPTVDKRTKGLKKLNEEHWDEVVSKVFPISDPAKAKEVRTEIDKKYAGKERVFLEGLFNEDLSEEQRLGIMKLSGKLKDLQSGPKSLDKALSAIDTQFEMDDVQLQYKLYGTKNLSPKERDELTKQRQQLANARDKSKLDKQQEFGDASAYSLLDLDADKAKATKTQMDDVVSEYKRKLKDIEIAEREAKENLTGPELQTALARYAQQRINIEQDTAKRVKEIWASEYSEKLNMQKTLIQEQLALDSRALQDQISAIEKVMRPIQNEVKKLQMDLEASQRARDSAKRPFQAGDGKRNTQWTADMAAFNADPYAWAGVQAISNTDTHAGLNTVSGATQREGLLKEADLMELEATNMVTDERITEADFKSRMQKAQLIRAKAAEMELATEGLKRERKLELEKEWAEAYAAWQQYATEAIDARYDVEDQRIQDNINLKNQQLQQQQTQIDNLQLQLSDLGEAAEKKIRPIDDELMRVQKTLRDQVTQWKDIKAGIEAARKEAEAYRAAMGAAGGVTGTGATSIDRSSSSSSAYPVDGGDGYYYKTSSDFYKAQKLGLESGGFIPDSSRFSGDGFGPVYLNRKEAVVPFDKWPEILRPFMRQGAPSVVFNPQITISGNHIVGEFDMYNTAYRAAEDLWRNNNDLFATNAGRLF